MAALDHVTAADALTTANGVALGYTTARAGDKPGVKSAMRAVERIAAPVLYVRRPGAPDEGGAG